MKAALGQLDLADPADVLVPRERDQHGILPLTLDDRAALQVAKLQELHRDPFDRMLICQAHVHGMTLVTPDPQIRRYPVLAAW